MSQVSYGQMTIADLTDNYQVQLSPESASFVGGTSSAKDGNITVIVSTLQGNKRIAHTIGTPTGLPTGMSVTNKTNGTASADGSFKVNVTTSLTSTNGYITIPITVDGVVYNRRFSYSVGRDGTSPTVTQTQVRYHQSTNGTTPSTIESDWVTPAPTAIAGQYMWTRTIVTYSDNVTSVSYSVSMNGEDGVSVTSVNSSKSGDETTITITLSDGTSKQFTVNDGAVGATAQWYYGDKLSHTSGTATLATSQTPDVVVGSMYLNPDTSLCYRCTNISGTNATWTYAGDLTTGVINNIEIGGRNLYIVANQIAGYINTSGTITNPSSTQLEKTSDYIAVSEGEQYVFQAWCPDLASNQQMWMAYQFYSNNTGTVIGGRTAKSGTTGVKYLAYDDIVVPSGATYIRVSYRTWDTGYAKFEKGNIPTDWTPAPEDVDAAIDEVQDNVTALDESLSDPQNVFNRLTNNGEIQGLLMEDGNVYINASYINTGTFKATNSQGVTTFSVNAEDGTVLIKALNDLGAYIRYDDDGLVLGKETSGFTLQLTNNRISFLQGSNEVAYIKDDKIYINNGDFIGSLKIGNFGFVPRSDTGNLSFVKM